MNERTIKTVLVSVPSVKGYSRHVLRVVDCLTTQNGHRNERGVKVLWESRPMYRPNAKLPRSQAYQNRQRAEKVREQAILGL